MKIRLTKKYQKPSKLKTSNLEEVNGATKDVEQAITNTFQKHLLNHASMKVQCFQNKASMNNDKNLCEAWGK